MRINEVRYYPGIFGGQLPDVLARIVGMTGLALLAKVKPVWANEISRATPLGIRPLLAGFTFVHGTYNLLKSDKCESPICLQAHPGGNGFYRLLYAAEVGHSFLFVSRSLLLTCATLRWAGKLSAVGNSLTLPIHSIRGAVLLGSLATYFGGKSRISDTPLYDKRMEKEAIFISAVTAAFWLYDVGVVGR